MNERISTTKYYFNNVANGIKKFTQSMCMKSIVNGFISVMPVIIVASIFTLLTALPEMIIAVGWGEEMVKYLKEFTPFGGYQAWGGTISNWSMGILGIFATVAISRNMGAALNEKLPFDRRINELTLIFSAISVYIMLSVVEFTVGANASIFIGHKGRAIFVDGLAAQGILPGILIALSMPWFFYWAMKYNMTIRLPKQVPQTISQAFIAIVPLLIVLFIYGTIAYGFNLWLGMPILFWLFEKIQMGLSNPDLNDSYGIIAAYTFMEGGFWFLGVHPEPVHAVMRVTFWVQNNMENAMGGGIHNHIFTEPYMYGFGAMGGSGCTLAIPFLCLLFTKSNQLKVVGKTGWMPIMFQVNEPTLFGVPTILNPLFLFPMIFTGMANDMIFKALADSTDFQAGSLWLPWSTPYFLQTSLGTPIEWQVWAMDVIALSICIGFYLPFIMIQDRIYVNEDLKKLGITAVQYRSQTGVDIIKQRALFIDFNQRKNLIIWKDEKKKIAVELKKNKSPKEEINKFKQSSKIEKLQLLNKANNDRIENLMLFNTEQYEAKIKTFKNASSGSSDTIALRLKDKQNNISSRIERYENKIQHLIDAKKLFIANKQHYIDTKKEKLSNKNITDFSKIDGNFFSRFYDRKIKAFDAKRIKVEEKLKNVNKEIKISIKKDPDVACLKKQYKSLKKYEMYASRLVKHCIKKDAKFKTRDTKLNYGYNALSVEKYSNYTDLVAVKASLQDKLLKLQAQCEEVRSENAKKLALGINPWGVNKTPATITKTVSADKQYSVLVLCLGAGSSAVLANAINQGLKAKNIHNINAQALAWGSHEAALKTVDLVILSPQMGANAKSLTNLSKEYGFKFILTRGKEYIDLSHDKEKAATLVLNELEIKV